MIAFLRGLSSLATNSVFPFLSSLEISASHKKIVTEIARQAQNQQICVLIETTPRTYEKSWNYKLPHAVFKVTDRNYLELSLNFIPINLKRCSPCHSLVFRLHSLLPLSTQSSASSLQYRVVRVIRVVVVEELAITWISVVYGIYKRLKIIPLLQVLDDGIPPQ